MATPCVKAHEVAVWNLELSALGFVSDFEFRISDLNASIETGAISVVFDAFALRDAVITETPRASSVYNASRMTHENPSRPARLAPWLRKRLSADTADTSALRRVLSDLGLATVCTEAQCPNQEECHALGTATFLILGRRCTRACRFCAVEKGSPAPPRDDEPEAVAEACERMGLSYVVVTSVTRDDLLDGGAGQFANTIAAIRRRLPHARVEVLTPDFLGEPAHVDLVLDARPDVFDHNVETVPRLYESVRPRAEDGAAPDYHRSLSVLAHAKIRAAGARDIAERQLFVKSGLMLGVGERDEEIESVLADLRQAGVDILTLGQYLAPSDRHWPVARFVEPADFARWETRAREMGFRSVLAGPFVRSSYHAEELIS